MTFDPYNLTPGSRMSINAFLSCLEYHKDNNYQVRTQSKDVSFNAYMTFDPYNLTPGSRMSIKCILSCLEYHKDNNYQV